MHRRFYVATVVLLVIVAALAGATLSSAFFSAPVAAEVRAAEDVDSQDARPAKRRRPPADDDEGHAVEADQEGVHGKWEYCAVTKSQYLVSNRGNQYWIAYFRGGRVQVVDVEGGVTGNALSNAIFKLGEEGWEMVGEGTLEVRSPDNKALYFKRRKP